MTTNITNNALFFLLSGAKWIKQNPVAFQDNIKTMLASSILPLCQTAREELTAASVATIGGKSNTGLHEAGWRRLAEVIGMCSPTSSKLADSSPRGKEDILLYWLKTGWYPSTRKDGKGGSTALKAGDVTPQQLADMGIGKMRDKGLDSALELLRQKRTMQKEAPATEPAVSRIIIVKD